MRMRVCGAIFATTVMMGAEISRAAGTDELVDNPVYQAWAGAKEGTRVMFKIVSQANGGMSKGTKHEVEKVYKLEAVEPERVVLSFTMRVLGQNDPVTQPMNIAVPAKIEKSRANFFPGNGEAKMTGFRESKDRMEVEKKVVEVKLQECDMETSNNGTTARTKVKVWIAEGVPGGVVRSVTSTAIGKADPVTTTITTTLVESEEPGK
jgi:hypothetical protein